MLRPAHVASSRSRQVLRKARAFHVGGGLGVKVTSLFSEASNVSSSTASWLGEQRQELLVSLTKLEAVKIRHHSTGGSHYMYPLSVSLTHASDKSYLRLRMI